jgi:HPt (histidine-containing phosphotransfer) domain-containing protein
MTLGLPPAPKGPAIDRSVLGEWLAGDDAAIDELLAVFRDSVRAEQAQMMEALARNDLAAFAYAAHRLRGAASSMGARDIADAAGALQAAARLGSVGVCEAGMTTLATHVGLMVAEVAAGPAGKID